MTLSSWAAARLVHVAADEIDRQVPLYSFYSSPPLLSRYLCILAHSTLSVVSQETSFLGKERVSSHLIDLFLPLPYKHLLTEAVDPGLLWPRFSTFHFLPTSSPLPPTHTPSFMITVAFRFRLYTVPFTLCHTKSRIHPYFCRMTYTWLPPPLHPQPFQVHSTRFPLV